MAKTACFGPCCVCFCLFFFVSSVFVFLVLLLTLLGGRLFRGRGHDHLLQLPRPGHAGERGALDLCRGRWRAGWRSPGFCVVVCWCWVCGGCLLWRNLRHPDRGQR